MEKKINVLKPRCFYTYHQA